MDRYRLPRTVTFTGGKAEMQGADLTAVFNTWGAVFGPERSKPPQSVTVARVAVLPLGPDAKNPTGPLVPTGVVATTLTTNPIIN